MTSPRLMPMRRGCDVVGSGTFAAVMRRCSSRAPSTAFTALANSIKDTIAHQLHDPAAMLMTTGSKIVLRLSFIA